MRAKALVRDDTSHGSERQLPQAEAAAYVGAHGATHEIAPHQMEAEIETRCSSRGGQNLTVVDVEDVRIDRDSRVATRELYPRNHAGGSRSTVG
jgi:hypothetical protein